MKLSSYISIAVLFFFISCDKKETKKDPEPTPVVTETKPVETPKVEEAPKLIFTVQVGAYKNGNATLSSLENVAVSTEEGLLKYRLGAFETYFQAKAFKRSIKDTYPDAFIQALENNRPIGITKALAIEK